MGAHYCWIKVAVFNNHYYYRPLLHVHVYIMSFYFFCFSPNCLLNLIVDNFHSVHTTYHVSPKKDMDQLVLFTWQWGVVPVLSAGIAGNKDTFAHQLPTCSHCLRLWVLFWGSGSSQRHWDNQVTVLCLWHQDTFITLMYKHMPQAVILSRILLTQINSNSPLV